MSRCSTALPRKQLVPQPRTQLVAAPLRPSPWRADGPGLLLEVPLRGIHGRGLADHADRQPIAVPVLDLRTGETASAPARPIDNLDGVLVDADGAGVDVLQVWPHLEAVHAVGVRTLRAPEVIEPRVGDVLTVDMVK